MTKSPLRYPGGKSRVAEALCERMPDFKEYREPFLGGGSVFITARQKFGERKYWVNDLYTDLYCFWKGAKEDVDAVVRQVEKWRGFYTNGRGLYQFLVDNMGRFNDIERAAAFFILNRVTFSGVSLSGGYSQESFEKRFTESSIERVKKITPLLDGVKITNTDYHELLSEEGEDVFIFMDPPYYSATKSALYGPGGELHKGFDHERFAAEVKECPHRWMITYDDCEYVRGLFEGYEIIPFEIMYGMRSIGRDSEMKGKEILIRNY